MKFEYDKIAHLYDNLLFFPHEKIFFNNFIQFINNNFIKNEKKNILEIACGTGNALTFFEKKNYCTGIDISSKMLDIARIKLKNTNLFQLDFRCFNFDKKFNVILCLFDSLNHTQDIISVFSSVKKHLTEDGVFIFDYYTKYGLNACIISSNDSLSVKTNNEVLYTWNINIKSISTTISEYVLPMPLFHKSIDTFFKYNLYDQNFNEITLNNIKSDTHVAQNQIERIVIVARLK